MTKRHAIPGAAAAAAGLLLAVTLTAQSPAPSSGSGAPAGWQVPRTRDGRPDLQGVWGNNSVTPMTRPRQWKDKTSLTDAEVQELKGLAAQAVDQGGDAIFGNFVQQLLDAKDKGKYEQVSYDPTTGNYNQFWMADREWDNRTSLIVDPPDGQFPPLTPEAETRRAEARAKAPARGPADGPEDRPLTERCISYGAPRTGANYNSYVQIIQSPDTVVLYQEMIHDARVVPMTAKPHLAASIRQLHGDPRGRWEGDTLVVETTNYLNGVQGSTPDVKLTERYTRVSPDFINWAITVEDPKTWTKPYTFMIRLKKTDGLIYEYACHEGNYAMTGILAGARAEEARAKRAK
ncbi:MAG TPA: hypothetical protein VL263_10325 [Vicinamibacterales bacterium]|jgi:hypothetical protein|nr:hypothetical protein [Vicinamibacterales bacterium]